MDASQLPKVWSANTYRHSLISKVVGVPVCEKAAYFFLSLLPYIYIIARILEFFKLFFNKPRQVTICISTLGDGCPFRPLGLNGAGRGIRTLTASQPADFKSAMSTIPSLPHNSALVQPKSLIFSFYSLEPTWTIYLLFHNISHRIHHAA